MRIFDDRRHAGQCLGKALCQYRGQRDLLVLALPRGGVPVAFEVAQLLAAPLDIFLVRKLGVPGQEELAMGAIASGGTCIINTPIVQMLNISAETIKAVGDQQSLELARREQVYRGARPPPQLQNKTVILVDDGLATGATMRVAAKAAYQQKPRLIIVAVPVASADTLAILEPEVDKVICLHTPEPFHGVGAWYRDFTQTSDAEVKDYLQRAAA